ncbi:MAG: class I SAM-dependent methyltransferase [Acidobacteriota bacterium]
MASLLKRLVKEQQFHPGVLGIFTNPFYFARKGLLDGISKNAQSITGRTLDVGCGQKPYERLMASSEYIGLEIDSPENRVKKNADAFYDGKRFPFADGEFDSALANQVFEHVFNPDEFLGEVNRVLKPGGMFLMTVPFVWDEHEQPFDFARYSSFGLRSLLQAHGFEVVDHIKSVNDFRVIFQLINDYLYKKTVTGNIILNQIFALVLMAPVTIVGLIISSILPKNDDLYLDNIILAKKIANA